LEAGHVLAGEVPVGQATAEELLVGEVLVDATPTDLVSGQPGLAYLRAALAAGMHGVALSTPTSWAA
jgi:homoserine dehydrogenase